MNSEFASFFDNDALLHKISTIWAPFSNQSYEEDQIAIAGDCGRISRKTKKIKNIHLELGFDVLYLFKDNKPHGQLNLVTTKMEPLKEQSGVRLIRNQQYVDIVSSEITKWKTLLSSRCLMGSFHDEFAVTKMIGKGSFAKVYLATKKATGTNYAIKAFNKEFMLEQFKGRESLENEIKVMRRLNQENLVRLHEAYETQNSIYFVLDVLKGGELLNRVKSMTLSTQDLQKLMYNLMKALAHLHSKKCMHRDLKPENLLLKDKDNNTDLVIADFGLATFLQEDILFKRCGTPGFVAPEILLYKEGDPFYDEKCDVFSAGIIFFLLITGKQPFQGADYKAILRANKCCEINYQVKQIMNAHPNLQDLLKKMLLPEPKQRISSEECLKHPYFNDIFQEKDLLEVSENLANYEKDYLYGLAKKSATLNSSMDLTQRQPAMNGNIDTMGSFSCAGSMREIEQNAPKQLHQSKFSQFCNNMKQGSEGSSSPMNKKNQQSDLHRVALKNSLQKNLQSKDDDYVNEECAQLEDAITKLNSQSPKMGLKKSNSFRVQKSTEDP